MTFQPQIIYGAFANTPAHELGAAALQAVVARAGIDKAEVSETISPESFDMALEAVCSEALGTLRREAPPA